MGSDLSVMLVDHPCTGSECPTCFPLLDRVGQFRDSRGITVGRRPDRALPSTTVIIVRGAPPYELLVHQRRDNQYWGFVGGAMEPGESILECAYREALEETGLVIALKTLVCVDSDPRQYGVCSYRDGRDVVQYCNLTFWATVVGGTLRLSDESLQLCWVLSTALPQPFLLSHAWRWAQFGQAVAVR